MAKRRRQWGSSNGSPNPLEVLERVRPAPVKLPGLPDRPKWPPLPQSLLPEFPELPPRPPSRARTRLFGFKFAGRAGETLVRAQQLSLTTDRPFQCKKLMATSSLDGREAFGYLVDIVVDGDQQIASPPPREVSPTEARMRADVLDGVRGAYDVLGDYVEELTGSRRCVWGLGGRVDLSLLAPNTFVDSGLRFPIWPVDARVVVIVELLVDCEVNLLVAGVDRDLRLAAPPATW